MSLSYQIKLFRWRLGRFILPYAHLEGSSLRPGTYEAIYGRFIFEFPNGKKLLLKVTPYKLEVRQKS